MDPDILSTKLLEKLFNSFFFFFTIEWALNRIVMCKTDNLPGDCEDRKKFHSFIYLSTYNQYIHVLKINYN